jgi:putative restriction endonuclease
MSYAFLSEYLPFDMVVPWKIDGRYSEEGLRNIPQEQVGVFLRGRSVRPLSETDFADLIAAGFRETLNVRNARRLGVPEEVIGKAADTVNQPTPPNERDWRIETVLSSRIIRDASFRNAVYGAYDNRCAVTGVRIIDNKGNSEVQAAHIWAVADGGPDVVQNGIALTATVHWLFDRHLLSITDDFKLLVAECRMPSEIRALLDGNGRRITLPAQPKDWPHPFYLKKHRDIFHAILGPDI